MMTRLFVLALIVFSFALVSACGQLTEDGTGLVFRTADPRLTIGIRLLPAPPAPIDDPQVVPSEETGLTEPDPEPTPPCEIVKANITRDGRKLYHVAGMPNFGQVKIDEAAGERFFCSVEEAEAAGWVRAGN